VLTRGVFHRQAPFVGSGGISAPVPRPSRRSRVVTTAERRSHAVLGLGRSCTVHSAQSDASTSFSHDPRKGALAPMCVPARPPFTRTATLFGALRKSLFETRCRLPTSATAYDVRARNRGSRFLAGTKASTFFLF